MTIDPVRRGKAAKRESRDSQEYTRGAILVEPLNSAIRHAQLMVSRYASDGAGLIEELIIERRAAADAE